jgi:hypothetical protein
MIARRLCYSIGLFASLVIGMGEIARSEEVRKHFIGASGQPVFVGNESQWTDACQWKGNPVYEFQNPKHGSISTRDEQKVIKSCVAGACGCLGKTVPGLAVYYTSEPGFHGKDAFSYSSKFNNGVVIGHSIAIDVR